MKMVLSKNRSILGARTKKKTRSSILLKRWLYILWIIVLAPICSAATIPDQFSFKNILENKDIALGEVTSILQDQQGFMWFGGANSLIRYDGYDFRPIQIANDTVTPGKGGILQTGKKASITGVQTLFEDSHHAIWIGARGGVFKYDTQTETIFRIADSPNQTLISRSFVKRIIEMPSGEIVVCSTNGLFIINPTTNNYISILPDNTKENWLKGKRVSAAYLDDKKVLWLGTDQGLEKVDWPSKRFTLYKPDSNNLDSITLNQVTEIAADEDGHFLLGTSGGLVHFDTQTLESIRYAHNPADSTSIGGNDVWKVLVDSQGLLWIATDGGGVSIFDKEHQRFFNQQHEAGRIGSISSNQVRTVYEDRNGDIWLGIYPAGINFFDRSSAAINSYARDISNPKSLSYNAIQSILEDDSGNLWLGTDGGGLNYFNRASGEVAVYKHDANDASSINGDAILSLFKDSTGLIWVGAWGGGLASFDPKDMKFTRYPFDIDRKVNERISISNKLIGSSIWTINEDKNGDLWLGTHTGGLSHYNRKTKMFTNYASLEGDPQSISNRLVWTTLEDSKGNFWVGTNKGLDRLDPEKGTVFHAAADDDKDDLGGSAARALLEDRKGRLWVGTEIGLNLYDAEKDQFTNFNKASGFMDAVIRAIVEDANGLLWVSTENGFSSFNPETKEIKNYNRINGRLTGGFATHAGTVSRNGEIIFGGVNGLRIIRPKELTENKTPPPIAITDFKVFADSVIVGAADGLLSQSINLTRKIELDYKTSMIAFSFAALNFRDPEKNQYAYKLDGFDEAWLDAGDQRVAKYTNLKPGKYVFRVKGSNNDGVWNDEGKAITIIQAPPPWQTWWAYSIYLVIFMSAMVGFFYQQVQKRKIIEAQNRLLEVKVAERTAEVTARTAEVLQKSKDIQIMLSNIPQGLFTVQNDGSIHSEYSQYLESIFETKNIAGRKASDLLFNGANLVGDELALARSAIFAIIGEDEVNFGLNCALLLNEYDIDINGHKKSLSLDWSPILEDGVVNRLMVSVRDVTHIKHMEDNLLQSEKLAALGALVAGVAHELNTPIGNGLTVATSLCESCETMNSKMKSGLTKSTLERFVLDMTEGSNLVSRNLQRASELVVSFKQVASDRTSAHRRKFSLLEVINEAWLTLSPSFKRTPYLVEIHIREDVVLDSYPGPLGQVITNLLNNALIHAFDGRDAGCVEIATENVFGGVRIIIEDNGVGIPLDNQAKIYDPFFTTKLGSGGNGLGMHIVHNIVTGVLGGSIQLKSTVGEGTQFSIYLPKAAPLVLTSADE